MKKGKKALIVGGSNGIGLSITISLLNSGYECIVVDKENIDGDILQQYGSRVRYCKCNLLDYDEELFNELGKDEDIEILMITAGFGRVSDFEYIHAAEINNIIQVNTVSVIKIIKSFYHRIKNVTPFFCGVMGSVAGMLCSPLFSVYAASKAGIYRFVESVNIELEAAGVKNRILNVSPGAIKGTRFNGGVNDIRLTEKLASDIISHLFNSDELFIPDYDTVYKNVIEQYREDAHLFGLNSYKYKIDSGRAVCESRLIVGYMSGTFDLFHVGHLNIIKRAKERCDYLIVGVHSDASHKGKETFIPFDERMEIVKSIKYVDKAVRSCKEDSDAWDMWHYNKLFVGSDYKGTERFERYENYFADKGVDIVYLPYTEITNSTKIRQIINNSIK